MLTDKYKHKMIDDEAVEMSVTNSLSQDYANFDNLPSSIRTTKNEVLVSSREMTNG